MIKAVIFDMYETLITLYNAPVYFSSQMAADAGIPEDVFRTAWHETEDERTLGRVTADEVITRILKENHCFSEEMTNRIMEKRIACKREAFAHMHSEIIPMLEDLKMRRVKIALISNCFSEEAMAIKESILYPYFDAVCLSYDEGLRKPDREIFRLCLDRLKLGAEECLYVGDGGSDELVAAANIGIYPVQAVWYLKDGTSQPAKRMVKYKGADTPLQVISMINAMNGD